MSATTDEFRLIIMSNWTPNEVYGLGLLATEYAKRVTLEDIKRNLTPTDSPTSLFDWGNTDWEDNQ